MTEDEFSLIVDRNSNWRIKELSYLKSACVDTVYHRRHAFIRALHVMCYAHWEGHIKFCADNYIKFLTVRRLRFEQISSHFFEVRFSREIRSDLSLRDKGGLVAKILSSKDDRFTHMPADIIETKSNLNSEILKNICYVCDIDFLLFEDEVDFIDRMLLRRRNQIAHGEDVVVEAVDEDDLVARTTSIMRTFRNALDNIVHTRAYMATA